MRLLLKEKRAHQVLPILMLTVSLIWIGGWVGTRTIAWPQAKGKISGHVLGTDGKALIGATVTLLARGGEAKEISATTDDEGGFSFSAVSPGDYLLVAWKGGYVRQTFGGSDPFNPSDGTPIHIGEGAEIPDIAIRLQKGGVITGKITYENGDPVVGANVQALIKRDTLLLSAEMIQPIPFLSDDRGVYRIYGLPSGKYLVSTNPQHTSFGPSNYPVTYYPGVTPKDEATGVEVTAGGEITGIDIEVGRGRKMPSIFGRVTRRADGTPMSRTFMVAFKDMELGSQLNAQTDEDGQYSFKNLTPGNYTVAVFTQDPELAERTQYKVDVSSGPVELNITIENAAEISGSFELEGRRKPGSVQGLMVFAISADDQTQQYHVSPQADGSFALKRLPGGNFKMAINADESKYYTKTIIYENQDITDEVLAVEGGAKFSGIRVVLADDGGTVQGTVTNSLGVAVTGAWVRVLPVDPERQQQRRLIRFGRTDHQGNFLVQGIVPGKYHVFAVRDLKSLAQYQGNLQHFLATHQKQIQTLDIKAREVRQLRLTTVD